MKKTQRTALCLLAALLLVSCGKEQTVSETSDSGSTDTTEAVAPADEYTYEKYDLGGRDFNILSSTYPYGFYETIDLESMTGETIDDEVYRRNRKVEDMFNMKLKVTEVVGKESCELVMKSVQAGEDAYDVATIPFDNSSAPILSQNCLLNLNDIADFQFDKPWWNKQLNDRLVIGSEKKLTAVFSDVSLSNFEGSYVAFINIGMAEDLGLDIPYDIVREGKWTLDKMSEYMKAGANLNGDSSFKYSVDGNARYGLTAGLTFDHAVIVGSMDFFTVEEDGSVNIAANSDKFVSNVLKLSDIVANQGEVLYRYNSENDNYEKVFRDERALMMVGELKAASTMRASDFDYGLLPIPKFDEFQSDYRTVVGYGFLFCIPIVCDTPNESAAVIDAMTYYTYKDVMPLFYNERISQKALRDDDSIEMLALISGTRCLDIGRLYGWSDSLYQILRKATEGQKKTVASDLASKLDKIEASIEKTVDAINSAK